MKDNVMVPTESASIDAQNQNLDSISKQIFGDEMCLRIVNPKHLVLLKDNARYFKRETFRQLRDNIAADKKLSSVPLCYQLEDGKLEVLSGNHRVKASIEAELENIMVLVITVHMETSKKIAIQLSHNSIVGEDDQSILANLWARVESVKDKLYSGLDSDMVKDLDNDIELVNFSAPTIPAHMVTFMFTFAERENLSEILDIASDEAKKAKVLHLAHGSEYQGFIDMVQNVKTSEKIKDSSLAVLKVIEIVKNHYAQSKAV